MYSEGEPQVHYGKMDTRKASLSHSVPQSTIRDHVLVHKMAMEEERKDTAVLERLTTDDERTEGHTDMPCPDKRRLEGWDNEEEESRRKRER